MPPPRPAGEGGGETGAFQKLKVWRGGLRVKLRAHGDRGGGGLRVAQPEGGRRAELNIRYSYGQRMPPTFHTGHGSAGLGTAAQGVAAERTRRDVRP